MQIKFSNSLQTHIADLMWEAKNLEMVKKIISVYGKEAEVVYNMLLAETFDSFNETDLAEKVIQKVK